LNGKSEWVLSWVKTTRNKMKKTHNRSVYAIVASMVCIAGIMSLASSAQASLTYDNTLSFIAGSGNSSGGWTTSTDNYGLGLALSLRAQYNNTPLATSLHPSDLTPNDGAGTFTFETGTSTRAVWDFWFDVNPGQASTTGDLFFMLSITSSLGGSPVLIPINYISDNAFNGGEFQNAEDIGFSFIGFDPSQVATYDFNLTAMDTSGGILNSVDMTVHNGTAAVPEPSTYVSGALLLLPFGLSTLRMVRKSRKA